VQGIHLPIAFLINHTIQVIMDHQNNHHSARTGVPLDQPLRALPVQLIATSTGAALKRGCVELRISGDRAVEALQILLAACGSNDATPDEICSHFAAPDRPAIIQLIDELMARSIMVPAGSPLVPAPAGEGALDLFYWNFGEAAEAATNRIAATRFVAIGVNHISRQLAAAFEASGLTNMTVVDYPPLRNISLFDDDGTYRNDRWHTAAPESFESWRQRLVAGDFDCLVATSDFGGLQLMREWNDLCVATERHFLPVVLQNMVGYIGPSVIAGETACFECFLGRRASNTDPATVEAGLEEHAFEGQAVAGWHPSMASVLGDIAAVELTKFYSRSLPLWKVGRVIEVNLIAGNITTRKVLRVPRCPVCSSMVRRSSMAINKASLAAEVIGQ
jgi:thiazole/oxazole-forming peptide maturase SagC family component